jgi:hypothetical protein
MFFLTMKPGNENVVSVMVMKPGNENVFSDDEAWKLCSTPFLWSRIQYFLARSDPDPEYLFRIQI